jgi:hypothetical protein
LAVGDSLLASRNQRMTRVLKAHLPNEGSIDQLLVFVPGAFLELTHLSGDKREGGSLQFIPETIHQGV